MAITKSNSKNTITKPRFSNSGSIHSVGFQRYRLNITGNKVFMKNCSSDMRDHFLTMPSQDEKGQSNYLTDASHVIKSDFTLSINKEKYTQLTRANHYMFD